MPVNIDELFRQGSYMYIQQIPSISFVSYTFKLKTTNDPL